jgi:hypothetical protein
MEYLNPKALDEWDDAELLRYQLEVQKMMGRYAMVNEECERAWDRKYPRE